MADAKAYPLDDTYYLAEALRKWNKVYTTGVFPETNNMRTVANNDMSVTVTKGFILLNDGDEGLMVWLDEDVNVPINTASGTLNRIDAITVQWDKLNNKVTVYPKSSNESTNPVLPVPERDDTDYEAFLSYVNIPSGTTAISSGNITDKRPDANVCGYIKSRAESIPTDMLQAQFLDLLEQYRKAIEDIGSLAVVDGSITIVKLNAEVMQLFTDINDSIANVESDLNGKITGINSSISTINSNITAINTNLGYKFDLGTIGNGVRNVQNTAGIIQLGSGWDMNNIKYTGSYHIPTSTTNAPVSTTGFLEVLAVNTSAVKQIYHVRSNWTTLTYARVCEDGTWNRWQLINGQQLIASAGGVNGNTVSLGIESVKKFGRLRLQITDTSNTTILGYIDMPIDPQLESGNTRAAHGTSSATGTSSLITIDARLTFNASSLTIVMVKQTSISDTGTISTSARRIGNIYGLPA